MLLQEKMQSTDFSPSEKIVVAFILTKQENIEQYSITMIAEETYTSPSVLVRIAKKLGFNGWVELKTHLLAEIRYLRANFQTIDANTPFHAEDSYLDIASKLAHLKKESVQDTLTLIQDEQLKKAVTFMRQATTVQLFTLANLTFLAEEFVYKLRHIHKSAEIFVTQNTMYQEAAMSTKKNCAILISYSGESSEILQIARLLKNNRVPMIAITSIGENSLSKLADVALRITTREKAYSKIAGFSSLESISLILDILYSCYFSLDYKANFENKVNLARLTELRQITNQIIEEEQI